MALLGDQRVVRIIQAPAQGTVDDGTQAPPTVEKSVVRIVAATMPGQPGIQGVPGQGLIVIEALASGPPAGTPVDTVVFRKRP